MVSRPLSRERYVLFTLALVLAYNFSASLVGWGWITATIISFGVVALNIAYTYRYRDGLIGRLVLFGLTAGFTELLADWYLVVFTGTLVYNPGGPFLVRSPLYMPLAWSVVLVQLGFIGHWLTRRIGLPGAMLANGLIGAINIPLYEEWARSAQWWTYQGTPMLSATPYYIILGEFLITLMLPLLLREIEHRSPFQVVLLGIGQGLWIWFSYALAFGLVG
ncbi:MAG: hypothetical protein D6759_11540 [Chloroflexi bacterium]|nr:MAG: hypothetical protein D6759_11540 [Chloroflexota bacterium]